MPLKVGDKAIEFTLLDTEKKPRSLKEFLGRKTVLLFYPGAFTGTCTKEMCTIRDSIAAFNSVKAQVVGISVDSPFANKGFANQNKLTFPLLSDYKREVVSSYGIALHDFAGLPGYIAAKRAVYVLDAQAVVKYAWVSDDPGVEPPYDQVRNALTSFS
jgi:peroxiredoxin